MLLEVKNFLEKHNIKNKKVIVGFSAGPDSCAMAFLLSKLANEFNLELVLAYFNHNWRVEEAKSEEEFTKDFALKISSEYVIEKAPLDCSKTEEVARDLRYSFFENIAKKYKSDTVILAHNKNDNIETLIYRVAKGTGTAECFGSRSERGPLFCPKRQNGALDVSFSRFELTFPDDRGIIIP